jgi:hypothetical protein
MRALGDPGSISRRPVQVIGLDPDRATQAFPELKNAAEPLKALPVPPPPGLALPDTARRLSVQVYALPPANPDDPPVSVRLTAYVQDALGIPYRVALAMPQVAVAAVPGQAQPEQGAQATPVGEWLTFAGDMPTQGQPPYRLMRIGINSTEGNIDAFEHTIYLDLVATQDAFGTSTPLDSFEGEANTWVEATVANPYAGSWTSEAANTSLVHGVGVERVLNEVASIDGPAAMRLEYRMGKMGGRQREPSIVVNEPQIGRIPVVINQAFAELFTGRGTYRTAADEPLKVGDAKNIVLNMGPGSVEIGYQVVGVIPDLLSTDRADPVMITLTGLIQPVINQAAASNFFFADNEVWLELPDRAPSASLEEEIGKIDGVSGVIWAWTRYGEIQREPLPSAVAGMLFAGFWISLLLSLLDFAFYLVVTARQRSFTFAVLRALGWNTGHIWRLLFIEQVVLITPALVIGSLIGAGLAYLLLPFLALVGGETLQLPWLSLFGLLLALVASFTILMGVAAVLLRRMSMNQVMRLGEE